MSDGMPVVRRKTDAFGDAVKRMGELEAEVERLRAERQEVLDVVNLYGDKPLHDALDAIGWPDAR